MCRLPPTSVPPEALSKEFVGPEYSFGHQALALGRLLVHVPGRAVGLFFWMEAVITWRVLSSLLGGYDSLGPFNRLQQAFW